ncbi:MAG TPA: thioredoxin-disulfide reductase [Isosphaeraceae bacterium]|jgi:thioredoxin reductase (NADPH)|nr:thioredoxin-disulfide reductase [Isosphaeraceae bacterium]
MSHSAVIVIGSGSAGLTAALYAARANLAPIVFEGKEPGGQLTWTTVVENFPGWPDGIDGPELMEKMRAQARRFGADCRYEAVVDVDLSKRPFRVITATDPIDPDSPRAEYTADALIVATGASAKTLGIVDEMFFMGHGLGTCATCDGALYRNKKVAVVGGGDTAVEEASFLTKYASQVTVIHRRDTLRASKIMRDRAAANPKIDYAWNAVVDGYLGEREPYPFLTGTRLRSTVDGSTRDVPFNGVFLAIGHRPNTDIFRGKLAMTPEGYLLNRTALAWDGVEAPEGLRLSDFPNYGSATNVEGVFAAGDVVDTHYRQAITAAGSGCAAAIDAERWLELGGPAH